MLMLKEINFIKQRPIYRSICTTVVCQKNRQAGKTKTSKYCTTPLTYEASYLPQDIAHIKSWNSWNTSALMDGHRTAETAIEDETIRRLVTGIWPKLLLSEIIIKRQFNMIRVAALVYQGITQRKMYFLIGYTEELLSFWLQCPVKLELQTVYDRNATVFKYI